MTRETPRQLRTSRKILSMFLTPRGRAVPCTLARGAVLTAALCCLAFTSVRACHLDWKGDKGALSAGFSAPRTALRQHLRSLGTLQPQTSNLQTAGELHHRCVVDPPTVLPNPLRSDSAAAAGGGAQHRSAAADTVKRAGFVYERLDCPCPPH